MPYDATRDSYVAADSAADPSKKLTLITAADADLTIYPKALRVYSASGCVVRVTPAKATADTDTVDITYPAGVFVEPLTVRRVWTTGTTGTPVIHGYVD